MSMTAFPVKVGTFPLSRFNGPQSLGTSAAFWTALGLVFLAMLLYPLWGEAYSVTNAAYLLIWAFMALSVSILWGFTGICSYGQTAFFGVAGYSYGAIAVNLVSITGETGTAMLAAILLAALVSLLVGYIMFYGGVSAL